MIFGRCGGACRKCWSAPPPTGSVSDWALKWAVWSATHVVAPLVAAVHVEVHDVRPVLERGDAKKGDDGNAERAKVERVVQPEGGDPDDGEDVADQQQEERDVRHARRARYQRLDHQPKLREDPRRLQHPQRTQQPQDAQPIKLAADERPVTLHSIVGATKHTGSQRLKTKSPNGSGLRSESYRPHPVAQIGMHAHHDEQCQQDCKIKDVPAIFEEVIEFSLALGYHFDYDPARPRFEIRVTSRQNLTSQID